MENKIKFILIGLVVLLCVFLFIILQLNTAKQTVERQRDDLAREADSLTKQNESISREIKRLQDERGLFQRQLDKISQEKEDIRLKYEMLVKERDVLIERLKTKLPVALEAQRAPAFATAPQTDDTYWAGILKEKTDLELQLSNLRGELKTIQIKNEELQQDKSTLELDLKSLNRENEDLKRQMEYNRKIMDTLSQEIVREKNDKFKIEASLKSVKSENELLRRQLKSLNNRRLNLERKLTDLEKENVSLSEKLNDIESFLQEKRTQVDKLKEQLEGKLERSRQIISEQTKESVELPPIVVRPPESGVSVVAPSEKFLSGKILAVNKENNFVIIDLGQDHGIKTGDVFKVYRQDKAIASLEVIQLRKEISACDIKKQTSPVQVGDAIR